MDKGFGVEKKHQLVSNIGEVRSMNFDSNITSPVLLKYNKFGSHQSGRGRVLLREPERCLQCAKTYISLYPLKNCQDHVGLDEV